ncbi:MAG TPA: hypothetical protein P5137_07260, partial [Candidatus Brocadiia bacterium]|nr:hypothetical protein [Candidatus Brocadiia bacterium]
MEDLHALAKERKLDDLEAAWMARLEEERPGFEELLALGEYLARRVDEGMAAVLLWALVTSARDKLGPKAALPMARRAAEAAPKDATLLFYHGQMTYKTDPGELILPPSVTELQGRGFRVGAVTMLAESHMHKGYLMVPFLTPRLARERMSEMGDRGMAVAQVFAQPNLAVPDLDIQAAAEFAWNGAGRSTEEFVASWAARRGSRDPEAVARVVSRLEYPARALSAAMQAGRMENAARVMADMVTGRRVGAAG